MHILPNTLKLHAYINSACTVGCKIHILSFHGWTALVDLGLHYEVPRSHSNTQYAVGLLWTSDRPIVLGGIRTRNPSKREAAGVGVKST
jgi:hypothetical protein